MQIVSKIILCVTISLFIISCTPSTSNLRKLSLGMTKTQVETELGEPTAARGAILNKHGQTIEVWEYRMALPNTDSPGEIIGKSVGTIITLGIGAASFKGARKDYWLYFYDNKLAQWGQAGDWKQEADRIYEFNFNPAPAPTVSRD